MTDYSELIARLEERATYPSLGVIHTEPMLREAAAALREQSGEIERLKAAFNYVSRMPYDADAAKSLDALRKDAERYRWLRERPHLDIAACWLLPKDTEGPDAFDAAIDAALAAGDKP